jgi:hypothetical protein|tara:strand:- start:152 stop:316 length:165 start_codon:yes stop_codon:yes gene_type:complete
MSPTHLERLRKDSRELNHYEKHLEKKGNTMLMYKIKRKREYLESKIMDITMEVA